MKIYIHGCSTCGINAAYIRKIKANNKVEVINSKYSEQDRKDHATNLMIAGLKVENYDPIVVEGTKITPLRLWKP